jgi:hypothetical protein
MQRYLTEHFNALKTDIHLNHFESSVPTSQRVQCVSITKTDRLSCIGKYCLLCELLET